MTVFISTNQALAKFVESTEEKNASSPENLLNNSFMNAENMIQITNFIFAIVFIFSVIGFLFAGLRFMTAGGSETVLEAAHKTWIASLTGLIISLAGYIILNVLKIFFF